MNSTKVFFLICNYNADKNKSLEKSLKQLSLIKRDNVKILVWDNGSAQSSITILNRYKKNNTIDFLSLSQNVGKANAINFLAKVAIEVYKAQADDVLISMDSDIIIHNETFIDELTSLYNYKHMGFISFEYYDSETFNNISGYHKLENGKTIFLDNPLIIDNRTYYRIADPSGHIAGALITMRFHMFISVDGYNIIKDTHNKTVIYGGDDSTLEAKLWIEFKNKFMFIFDSRKQIVHLPHTDPKYNDWKAEITDGIRKNSYSDNSYKGFYD